MSRCIVCNRWTYDLNHFAHACYLRFYNQYHYNDGLRKLYEAKRKYGFSKEQFAVIWFSVERELAQKYPNVERHHTVTQQRPLPEQPGDLHRNCNCLRCRILADLQEYWGTGAVPRRDNDSNSDSDDIDYSPPQILPSD